MEIFRVESAADGSTAGLFFDRQSAVNAMEHLNGVSSDLSEGSPSDGPWHMFPEEVISGENLQWRKLWCVYVTREVEFTADRRMNFTGKLKLEKKLLEELSLTRFRDSIVEPIVKAGELVGGATAALYGDDLAALKARGAELAARWDLLISEGVAPQ